MLHAKHDSIDSHSQSNTVLSVPYHPITAPVKQKRCATNSKSKEVKMLFPPKAQQLRGNKRKPSKVAQKEKSWENARHDRTPLTEIYDTSFESPPHSEQNHLHTHNSYTLCDKHQNPSQQRLMEPLGGVDTLSCSCVTGSHEHVSCKTSSKTVENMVPTLAENGQEKEYYLKGKGNKEAGGNKRRAERKNGDVLEEKGMVRRGKDVTVDDKGSGSDDQRSIHNLSLLVDTTCISTTQNNCRPQPTVVSGVGSSVTVGNGEREHTQIPYGHCDPSYPFDLSTFCLPTSSTPRGARRVQVLCEKEDGSNKCNESSCSGSERCRKMGIVKQTQTPSIKIVPQICLCEREEKEYKKQYENGVRRRSLEKCSSTAVMFKHNLSTPSNTPKIHSSLSNISNFSNATILAPETPPELWGFELVGSSRTEVAATWPTSL